MVGVLLDDSGADLFGDAGKEKRTLVDSLLASEDGVADKYVEDDVAVMGQVVVAQGCGACCHCQRRCCR